MHTTTGIVQKNDLQDPHVWREAHPHGPHNVIHVYLNLVYLFHTSKQCK